MRYFLSIAFLFCCAQLVFATNDPYVQTIKEMYRFDKKSQEWVKTMRLFSNPSLNQAFNLHDKNGGVCGFGQNVMWQSQDPEYNIPLNFTKFGQNKVKVSLGKGKWNQSSIVIYTLQCNGGNCKISDANDSDGSLKQNILRGCKI